MLHRAPRISSNALHCCHDGGTPWRQRRGKPGAGRAGGSDRSAFRGADSGSESLRLLTLCARSALASLAATMAPGTCHATCPLGLKVRVGVESGVESHKLGREPIDSSSDALAARSDRQPVRSSLLAALPLQSKRVVLLLWLLLGVPMAAAASLPSDPLHSCFEPVASDKARDKPSGSFGSDFTVVAPGMFDKLLALMDAAPDGQHGRALSECVSAGSRTLRLPNQHLKDGECTARFNGAKHSLARCALYSLCCAPSDVIIGGFSGRALADSWTRPASMGLSGICGSPELTWAHLSGSLASWMRVVCVPGFLPSVSEAIFAFGSSARDIRSNTSYGGWTFWLAPVSRPCTQLCSHLPVAPRSPGPWTIMSPGEAREAIEPNRFTSSYCWFNSTLGSSASDDTVRLALCARCSTLAARLCCAHWLPCGRCSSLSLLALITPSVRASHRFTGQRTISAAPATSASACVGRRLQ